MIAFTSMLVLAIAFFIAHVVLLFTSFGKTGFQKKKYFWSHLTLWITGVIAYLVTVLYAGKGISPIVDLFDTAGKQALLLLVVVVLSIVAHTIVKLFVLPKYTSSKV
ncbi:hypothetical protein MKQ68_05790 [Chitinophaga horti]|uniref:Uncharacterized protein n=1 Tax=Chitinophaga horti TaxID=2920382 RepID=A0ABY6J4Q0_9BACT|nr:hypothetical protein [Chitinophaga horti]UYQ94602.1 hypothetical protein MKQ68_05790 [Chitinophaga horti]